MRDTSKFRPKTIEEIGLKNYLESISDKLNGYTYDDIVKMFEADVNPWNIGKMIKVDYRTAKKWKQVWRKESGRD